MCITSIHKSKVAHLDLKLDNCVILDDYSLALIDFGSAEDLSFSPLTNAHCQGTVEYRSPEQ